LKEVFIKNYTTELFSKLKISETITDTTKRELLKLRQLTNIRNIKREIESIVVSHHLDDIK